MGRDRDLIVRAGRDIDRSEIDVDDEFAAGRAIEGLTNVFFRERGRSRRGNEEQEKSANDHRSRWVEVKNRAQKHLRSISADTSLHGLCQPRKRFLSARR